MRLLTFFLFVTLTWAVAPPRTYPECNDGDVDTMDFCGGTSANPIWCSDDFNHPGAHLSDGTPISGSCLNIPRPLRNGGGDSPDGACHVALGWAGAQNPANFEAPFTTFDYPSPYPGSRFLFNSMAASVSPYNTYEDPGGMGGYVWHPANVNNMLDTTCPPIVNQAVGAPIDNTHSVTFSNSMAMPNGCGFKHGIPIDTDKNIGVLVSLKFYPFNEYVMRVYWSATDMAAPVQASDLYYLGCVNYVAGKCALLGFDEVGRNSLYLLTSSSGQGLVQINVVRGANLNIGYFPRGELWFIFDAFGPVTQQPSIADVMFMYLNIYTANGPPDCRWNQQCYVDNAAFTSTLTQATIYGTYVMPIGYPQSCDYDADPCSAAICNGATGTCQVAGFSGALTNNPQCMGCAYGQFNAGSTGCLIGAFSQDAITPTGLGAAPNYRTRFKSNWDSYGRLPLCGTGFQEPSDNGFTNSGRISEGLFTWTWYAGASPDIMDIQYMNNLWLARTFPLDAMRYPDGAALVLDYQSHCASFTIGIGTNAAPPIAVYCSNTISVTPGSNDFPVNCYANFPSIDVISEIPANGLVLDLSSFMTHDMTVYIFVDNDVSAIFTAAPACASVTDPYLQLIFMAVIPTRQACGTGDACVTNGRCHSEQCEGTPVVCPPSGCASSGSCSAGSCSYDYMAENANCNDNNVCTTDSCTNSGCTHTAITCGPPVVCQVSTGCDATLGCMYGPAPDGTLCPGPGTCDSGTCIFAFNSCATDADCVGRQDACNTAQCVMGTCSVTPIFGACDPGSVCYASGTCVPGSGTRHVCQRGGPVACDINSLPANTRPCVSDYGCDSVTGCTATYHSAGTLCDDSDPCTENDQCDMSGVCAGTPMQCPESDDCNTVVCSMGACVSTPQPDGTTCVAPFQQTCGQGACKKIQSDYSECVVEFDSTNCMLTTPSVQEYACITNILCTYDGASCQVQVVYQDPGSVCSDPTDLCGVGGSCQCYGPGCFVTTCEETPNTCSSYKDQCTTSTCDSSTGRCDSTPLIGSQCQPSDLCLTDGMCVQDKQVTDRGFCDGTPVTCPPPPDTGDAVCITGFTCQSDSGLCGVELVPDGSPCMGDLCFTDSECQYGLCLGDVINCNDEGPVGLCDVGPGPFQCQDGNCESIVAFPGPGVLCDDGLFCNGPEIIYPDGVCGSNPSALVPLPAPTNCTATYCDEATDSYVTFTYNPYVGAPCSPPISGPCTMNHMQCGMFGLTCNHVYTPVAEVCGDHIDNNCNGRIDETCMSASCTTSSSCPHFRCYTATCVMTIPPILSVNTDSTSDDDDDDDDDSGNTGVFMCQYAPTAASTPCTLADPCFTNPMCDGIGNCIGTPIHCDDGILTTLDTCSNGVCIHTIVPNTPCDDHDPCTVNDIFGQNYECHGTPITCHTCNECTSVSCVGGSCVLANLPMGTACNDENVCTVNDECDGNGNCVGLAFGIAGGPQPNCYTTLCDPIMGVTTQYAPFGGICDTGIPALQILEGASTSTCINGLCKVKTPLLTDTGSPGCGGSLLTCNSPGDCENAMIDFLQLIAEESVKLMACAHTIYNDTTHTTVNPTFTLDDSMTIVALAVNDSYSVASVKEWMEKVHAELAVARFCPDFSDCEQFLTGMRRLRAIYDILLGLNLHFQCRDLESYGIFSVVRKPTDSNLWMLMAWDDSLDMTTTPDYDLNDLVVRWHVNEGLDSNGRAVLSELRYEIAARGSEFNHNLKWFIKGVPCSPTTMIYSQHDGLAGQFAQVLAYKWAYDPIFGTIDPGVVMPYNGCGIEVFHSTKTLMPAEYNATSTFANTLKFDDRVLPHRNTHLVVSVNYGNKQVDADDEALDSIDFLSRYYHVLDVIGKGDVASLLVNLHNLTSPVVVNMLDSMRMGLPMMQNLPCDWQWPVEEASVFDAYDQFTAYANWLVNGGTEPFPPWYTVPSNVTLLFVP